jgi:hypothetical protein
MKKILAIVALLCCSAANAALVDQGNTILDTSTNLQWMDLTSTLHTSYNQMQADFLNPHSVFYGYKYGSLDEVSTLFAHAGNTQQERGTTMMTLFGQTGTYCCARSDGIYEDGDGNAMVSFYLIVPTKNAFYPVSNYFNKDTTGWSGNGLGSFIYKTATAPAVVPEPPMMALFGTALAGLAFMRRRKLRK